VATPADTRMPMPMPPNLVENFPAAQAFLTRGQLEHHPNRRIVEAECLGRRLVFGQDQARGDAQIGHLDRFHRLSYLRIGASLEAAPVLYIADPEVAEAVKAVEMADLCITSGLVLAEHEPPAEAFRLDDPAIGVVFELASGEKCLRCWKVLDEVGRHGHGHPGVCGRCDAALGGVV
ncbi:MAG: hypothetical protein E4H18_05915, partial [Hyphomicrobiales bacterium]